MWQMKQTERNGDPPMKALTPTATSDERFTVPWDMGEWARKDELLAWLDQEIAGLDWTNPELVEILKANPSYQPRLWLTLLSYAYALGICESEEIVALFYQDSELRGFFPGATPTAKALTRFRRDNRGLVKWCLTELFRRVLREKFELGDVLIPAGLRRYLADAATARLDVARSLDWTASGGF
jgi:hypothetical protein